MSKPLDFFGRVVFNSRFGLIPMYLSLYAGILAYTWVVMRDVFDLLTRLPTMSESDVLLVVIGLIDMNMIGNLISMTMIGGWSIFINEYNYDELHQKPRWMHDFNTTAQKAKMGMSLVAIASVYLLKDYIQSDTLSWDTLLKRVLIIFTFIVIAVAYGFIARAIPHDTHTEEKH